LNFYEEATHASLVYSFWILGRIKIMELMTEAGELKTQAVVHANQYN